MASTFTPLGIELQATGENAGTWGTKTNTNLQIFEQISGGFTQQSIAGGAQTTTLSVSDGSTGAVLSHRMIEFTGTITGNQIVTIPLDVQTFYLLRNSTSGAHTVQFKYVSGSGDTFTFATTNKGDAVVFATANDGTNPDILTVNTGIKNVVEDTTPQLGGNLDVNGNNIVSVSNGNVNIAPNGTGVAQVSGSAIKVAGKETIWIPAVAMYPNTTNGAADLAKVELSNGPEINTLDFDKDSDEFAQFAVAFPKSWNEGTVTFQTFFTADSTNTGNAVFKLQGVALADNGDLNTAFGTAVGVAKAHSGTANDLNVATESGAVTIAGSPSTDEYVFFQIFRDANDGDDTLTADAKLLGIKLFFTTDAANDA